VRQRNWSGHMTGETIVVGTNAYIIKDIYFTNDAYTYLVTNENGVYEYIYRPYAGDLVPTNRFNMRIPERQKQ